MKQPTNIFLLFPQHLFRDVSIFKDREIDVIYLIEDPLYFGDVARISNFNKLKLVYYRATMRAYYDYLMDNINTKTGKTGKTNKIKIHYIESPKSKKYAANFYPAANNVNIYFYDPVDHLLESRVVARYKHCASVTKIETPNFLTSTAELREYFAGRCAELGQTTKEMEKKIKANKLTSREKRHLFMQTSFYGWQRRRLNLLMKSGKPLGGKLTYDAENRRPLPSNVEVPAFRRFNNRRRDAYLEEARRYISRKYKNNIGSISNEIIFPIMHEGTEEWLDQFLEERLRNFGKYQDAFITNADERDNRLLFHSGISPMMNIGLINPADVIHKTMQYYQKHKTIPLTTIEGFLRQVVGWREHCRYTYLLAYPILQHSNYLKSTKKLGARWYAGTTGLTPLDDAIKRAFSTGYLHHILRLMVIGSFMMMSGIHPEEAFRWFYEFSLDSAEWNMINNVKSMAMYADGGLYTTKPYIASSAYIKKMSNYEPDGKWDKVWDAMYWTFVDKHRGMLKKNGRMAIQVKYYDKKSKEEKRGYKKIRASW